MKKSLRSVIPSSFRRQGGWVVVTIFLRAILNFLGLALLLPILLLILESQDLLVNPTLQRLYTWGGFDSEQGFILAICFGIVGIIVLKGILSLLLYLVERNYIYRLYRYLSQRLYTTYYRRGLAFIKQANSAILSRNVNGVTFAFVAGVLRPMAAILCEGMLFGLLFTALLLYNWQAALLVVGIFLPTLWGYYRLVRRRLNRYGEQENRAQREKARIVIETFRGYPEVEINHAFPTMLRRFDHAMEELISVQRKHALLGVLPSLITESVLALGMALLVLFSLSGSGGDMRLLFGIFAVAALRLMPSIRNVMTQWATIKYNRYTVDTLREAKVDEGCETPLIQAKIQPLPFRQEIELCNVSFAFDDAPDKPVIQDLSLAIRKGERIGIRGTSGAGKTTLFHLLLGLYTPTRGEILIDGEPLTERNRRAWQNNIGYVSQTVFLTDATFAENVALGEREEEIDLERVRQALKQAQLESLIEGLPLKEKTPIGECGCRLSGGQRQRIGIARALYKGAHVLLFDEATSALDSQTEEEINRSIERLFEQRKDLTLLVIAHRETSLEHCDRVIDL